MTHRLDYCESFESLKLKLAKGKADTPGCCIVGNYTALGSDGPAGKLALGELNNILAGDVANRSSTVRYRGVS